MASGLLACAAVLAMAVAPVRAAAPAQVMWIAMCNGGAVPLPLPESGQGPGKQRERDCPGACHINCSRSLRGEGDETAE